MHGNRRKRLYGGERQQGCMLPLSLRKHHHVIPIFGAVFEIRACAQLERGKGKEIPVYEVYYLHP